MLCIATILFEILEIVSSNEQQSQRIFKFPYRKEEEGM